MDTSLLPSGPERTLEGWPDWSILIVDDEQGMLNFLVKTLAPRCHFVMSATSAEDGAEWLRGHRVDLVVLDISLPGKSGVVWLKELRDQGYTGEVILITAFADLDTAIEALRAGASDFILKPFRVPQILNAVKPSFDRARLARENFVLKRDCSLRRSDRSSLVGDSRELADLRGAIARLAGVNSTVLLQGESGTGKELVARELHLRLLPLHHFIEQPIIRLAQRLGVRKHFLFQFALILAEQIIVLLARANIGRQQTNHGQANSQCGELQPTGLIPGPLTEFCPQRHFVRGLGQSLRFRVLDITERRDQEKHQPHTHTPQ